MLGATLGLAPLDLCCYEIKVDLGILGIFCVTDKMVMMIE